MTKEELIEFIKTKQRENRILSKRKTENIIYPRKKYNKLKNYVDNFLETNGEYYNRLIMMPGLRGVGKTTILYQIFNHLIHEKDIPEENILFLDVHDLKSISDNTIKDVFETFLEDMHQSTPVTLDKKIFFLVDEAQFDPGWAGYTKLLYEKSYNIFMIITGSSAIELEVNTDAVRRITRQQIFPCDFNEYLLLKYGINLSKNNFKDLILKCDEESIAKAVECEKTIKKELINIGDDPEIELKHYLHSKGLPFSLNLSEMETHIKTNEIIERIVNTDLDKFTSFKIDGMKILQIISYIATKKPGKTSTNAIAQALELNTKTVTNILDNLEKTQLIFKVTAYGSAGKMLKKPSQHFFLTPSLKSAQNYLVGSYNLNHEKCYGALAENLVASSIKLLSDETFNSVGLFYDANKKGVDFIVRHLDRIIPIEVGIGKKTKSQLTIAKNKYNADYAILVSNRTKSIKYENGILYIPLLTFALM